MVIPFVKVANTDVKRSGLKDSLLPHGEAGDRLAVAVNVAVLEAPGGTVKGTVTAMPTETIAGAAAAIGTTRIATETETGAAVPVLTERVVMTDTEATAVKGVTASTMTGLEPLRQ